ncbi:hypothetical protein Aple_027170 [Acrocarpospora pleiomorpha]|uniref:DUF6879 domain-containing protein n=1 Tax=Acrocarpospora pleiomorpha TaxID=90975 RepID=A0A5M3XJI7_9ACTN|nr:DUF6879 family protein [Acrocarpospora pleiomorpha]GES19821.1 hypothetical protein Aple_027170 [Acrocarpospora pleiomorpha]
MNLLSGENFDALFHSFNVSAFRLESRERYHLAKNEEEPLRCFLAGEPVDMGWLQFWIALVGEHVQAGRTMRRVRVVSRPFSDYTRFGLMAAEHNIAAGDHIRYMERVEAEKIGLPVSDWWLFDDERVALVHYTPDDILLGAEIIADPAEVDKYRSWRDSAWANSTAREEFVEARA